MPTIGFWQASYPRLDFGKQVIQNCIFQPLDLDLDFGRLVIHHGHIQPPQLDFGGPVFQWWAYTVPLIGRAGYIFDVK